MKEAANSLLKVLEEPPEFATIFLLTENAGELLPTIRSRSMIVTLNALTPAEIELHLEKYRPDWNPKQRALVARLCEGAVGRARSFDLEAYTAARPHALTILNRRCGVAITANFSKLPRPTAPERRAATKRKSCCARSTPFFRI